jgi:hypothetical protein
MLVLTVRERPAVDPFEESEIAASWEVSHLCIFPLSTLLE